MHGGGRWKGGLFARLHVHNAGSAWGRNSGRTPADKWEKAKLHLIPACRELAHFLELVSGSGGLVPFTLRHGPVLLIESGLTHESEVSSLPCVG